MAQDSIGALWVKEGKSGKYMSGVIDIDGVKVNIVVFKNSYKREDKHPDYRILRSKPREAQQSDDGFKDDVPF
jgi:uncharacterized protein (DUF736 family)